jgi:MFS transporter, ACDE family, multidrug resistance protein
MRAIHFPAWAGAAARPSGPAFAILFTLSGFARATMIAVLPLLALSQLGTAQRVSVFYFALSAVGMAMSLTVPWLARIIKRRGVFSFGVLAMLLAFALFATRTPAGLLAGMAAYVFAGAAIEISLQLYVLDHIPRRELTRFEPLRVFFAAGAWTLGPWLGVFLQAHVADWAPFAAAAASAAALLGYFWHLRVNEHPAVPPMTRLPPSPLRYLPRFFRQPRLRLAWFLAFGRSAWWTMFFVYAPLYAVTSGLGEVAGGAIVSAGTAFLFLVPVWGWVARRKGVRWLLIGAYTATGVVTLGAALVADSPWAGAAALVLATLCASVIDGAGNVAFLRAVHPFERAEMTTVFTTYRDASQLAPPGVFSLLLKLFELPVVFLAAGAGMFVVAYYARFLPRRL